MKALLAPAVLLLALAASPSFAEEVRELEGPTRVDGLRVVDANGDDIEDLLLLEGRTLWVYPGRSGDLPDAAPAPRLTLPDDANQVAGAPAASPGGSGVLVLGREGLRHLALPEGTVSTLDVGDGLASWRASGGAAFVDFARPDGTLLIPLARGWRVAHQEGEGIGLEDLEAAPFLEVEPAGPFLEDTHRVVCGHRRPFFGLARPSSADEAPPATWLLAGGRLAAVLADRRFEQDISRIPPRGSLRLLDLDGDRVPDLCHREGSNRYGVYTFYRNPGLEATEAGPTPPRVDLTRPATRLRLEGSNVLPTHVDLDGDGRQDFVVTTIPIDARNTARALGTSAARALGGDPDEPPGGLVTAHTHAWLHREGEAVYPLSPDASVTSDIGVAIRFSKAGTIDVRRSFTILVDADVDGDGRKDLVIRTGPDALAIRRGARSGVWDAEGREVSIPPMGRSPDVEAYRADLDGDGADEIVLLYRAPPGGRDVVRVVRVDVEPAGADDE